MKPEVPFHPSPVVFTWKQRLGLAVSSWAIATVLKILSWSCRLEVRNRAVFDSVQSIHKRALIAVWHESLGLCLWLYHDKGYATLTSYSFDGELAARVSWRLGMEAVRGSSSRGGARAVVRLVLESRKGKTVGLTIDGPRGPCREAKPGIAILSLKTGVPVLPVAFAATPAWRLRSWDRLMIPRPFGRIICVYGEPIPPPRESSLEAVERMRQEIEQSLNRLHDSLEQELSQADA